jgi:SAM-dependent methyltransferase
VVAVEPALTMIRQRPPGAAPVVRGHAEGLPFGAGAFAAGLAVLTLHHWSDWRAGVRELLRVVRRRVVIFTWDPAGGDGFWLRDYFPRVAADDRARFPAPAEIAAVAGAGWTANAAPFPVPHDCSDGFLGAYWRRPEAYLDPAVRAAISSLAPGGADQGLRHLAADLSSGEWQRRHGQVLPLNELDVGYRLVTLARP